MNHNFFFDILKTALQKFYSISFGQLAFSSLIIAGVSGIFLAIPYDIKNPYDSISLILLTNPAAAFFRNLHYWSAQLFLFTSIFHIIDHFIRRTEIKLSNGEWMRVTLSLCFLFYVMISGFILKGDVDSENAANILKSLFNQIPVIGKMVADTVVGKNGDFQLIYVHHIVTSTLFLWIVTIEHSKFIWAELKTFLFAVIMLSITAFLFTPYPNDGRDAIIKGPWYFVGLQELLHWIPYTEYVLFSIFFLLVIFYLIKNLKENISLIIKKIFLGLLFLYLVLTIIGNYFRGENWKFVFPWNNPSLSSITYSPLIFFSDLSDNTLKEKKFNQILGRREGCIVCHQMTGFSKSHDPEAIGCFSCHLGNAFTLNKSFAHEDMVLIPGNMSDVKYTCGRSACHSDIVQRVKKNIMTSMSGVISVNRFVFDEATSPSVLSHIKKLTLSNADSHLRNLCASCHLGNEKIELGPINELSRGGGCNACHLNYTDQAYEQLNDYLNFKIKFETSIDRIQKITLPQVHPNLNLQISNNHCFGCHSRSGRIATNYEGWFETIKSSNEVTSNENYRILMDGRIFQKAKTDIHFEKGLECIDCHLAQEIMGDGNFYLHKEEQIKIECIDCHSVNTNNKVNYVQLDYESKKIVDLRNSKKENSDFIITEKSKLPLINSYISTSNQKYLVTKTQRDSLSLKPPALVCTESKAHQRLSCNSCHTEWVSYCIGCHTEYNPNEEGFDLLAEKEIKGSWIEYSSDFYVEYPALGVRKEKSTGKETIETFIPGMIISIERMKNDQQKKIFKRLFAPIAAHTINKNGRSCKSCHFNSLTLGYGKGKLKYEIQGNKGEWKFTPQFSLHIQDSLPKDSWVGFLQTRNTTSTTRTNTRPFTIEEQKRILLVGACLTCHNENSKVMKESLNNFEKLLKRISNKCILPS